MNLSKMYHKNPVLFVLIPFTLFLVLISLLLFTREAWIDESWFAAYAIQFIRSGEIADLNMARFTGDLSHQFFFYFYSLLQAPFYATFGESLIVGRMITALSALLGLWIMYRIFTSYLDMKKEKAIASMFIIAFTYYYIYPATQIRPDLIAVVFVLAGLVFLKNWLDRKGSAWLMLTHLMFILAILLHMQAGFAWVGLLVFLAVNRLNTGSKLKAFLISLPVYIVIGALFYFNEYFDENMRHYYEVFFGSGNMAGHKGGMIKSMIEKYNNEEYIKLAVRAGIVLIMVVNFLYYIYLKNIKVFLNDPLFLVAGASFGSWLLTTTQINDYHAVWLILPFMLMCYNMFQKSKAVSTLNILFMTLMIIPTFIYTFETVRANPLKKQSLEVNSLIKKYNLLDNKVFIDRDLMWFFDFGENVTYRLNNPKALPDYLLLRKEVHKSPQYSEFENRKYRMIDDTSLFSLYKKVEND